MKSHCARKWPDLILLFGLLSGSCLTSFAVGPQQHAVHGVVEHIDHTKRTLLLVEVKTHARRVFVWNDSTRFRQDGKKIIPEALQPGAEVKGYYRKEVGRFVLHEVRWSNTSPRTSGTATQANPENALPERANILTNPRGDHAELAYEGAWTTARRWNAHNLTET